jgi:hypothetical protein
MEPNTQIQYFMQHTKYYLQFALFAIKFGLKVFANLSLVFQANLFKKINYFYHCCPNT